MSKWYQDIVKAALIPLNEEYRLSSGIVEFNPELFMGKELAADILKEFQEGFELHMEVENPKMHALNFSGEYRFRYTKDGDFLLISPLETRFMSWRAFTDFINHVEMFFTDIMEDFELGKLADARKDDPTVRVNIKDL
jgi:hypothetical protein